MTARAELLVQILRERHGLTISEATAREDISNHVDYVAATMAVTRRTAKRYITEDTISDMADRVAHRVRQHVTREALTPSNDPPLRIVR